MSIYCDFRRLTPQEQRLFVSGADLHATWTPRNREKYLGFPDIIDERPYHTKHFFLRSRVEAATPLLDAYLAEEAAKRTARAAERKAQEARATLRWNKRYAKKYATWTNALPAACDALFELNRFAKYRSCVDSNELYSLKNRLITLLYTQGYGTDCYLHTTELPEQECWTCNGTGRWHFWYSDESDDCHKCDGTGIYRFAKALMFVVFYFAVGGKTYCWHQPKENVDFEFQTTQEANDYKLSDEEKAVSFTARQRTEGKHLISWVLAQGAKQIEMPEAA